MISSSFFTRIPKVPTKKVPEYQFIDVGREPFHALAVALIDYLSHATHIQEAALKKLLDRFFIYYPHYKSNQGHLTPAEQMQRLINSSRRSELVECMAFVLRQLSVDELYAHPLDYPEVFALLNRDTGKNYLRQSHISLPPSAMAALAHALGLPLTLIFREPGKELAVKEDYLHGMRKERIRIQIQGEHYFPGVKNKEEFAFVGQLAIHPPEPVMDRTLQDHDALDDIFHTLDTEQQEQLHAYTHWRHVLSSMVKTGEFTKEQLLSLYIQWLPKDTKKAGFLMELAQQKHPQVAGGNVLEDTNQQLLTLLIDSLASWVSVKEVSAEQLFGEEEELEKHQSLGFK